MPDGSAGASTIASAEVLEAALADGAFDTPVRRATTLLMLALLAEDEGHRAAHSAS